MATTQVSKYRLIVRSGGSTTYHENLISLYNSGGTIVANLRFTDALAPAKVNSGGYFTMIYPRSQYLAAVDMLRNESPVYFVDDNADEGGIRTGTDEAVGEDDV